MTAAVLTGSTGLVGSNVLSLLLVNSTITTTHAYTRRFFQTHGDAANLTAIISSDTTQWPTLFPSTSPPPKLFISALGTTRAASGGAAGQRKIDLDLNLSLARAAHAAGVVTCIIVTSGGASSSSIFGYQKMKGELEDAVTALGFKHTVFVRPGYITGSREGFRDVGVLEKGLSGFEKGMRAVMPGMTDVWAQSAEMIARASVRAGLECLEGKRKEGVWVLGSGEIVRLGREK